MEERAEGYLNLLKTLRSTCEFQRVNWFRSLVSSFLVVHNGREYILVTVRIAGIVIAICLVDHCHDSSLLKVLHCGRPLSYKHTHATFVVFRE